ncbi:hypothetical protein [Nocardia salmonicida]
MHALVIGITDYEEPASRKTGILRKRERLFEPLPGAAPAATHFARFLLHDYRQPDGIPLRSVRLLLAPSSGMSEADKGKYLITDGRPYQVADYESVVEALEEWADDCDTHVDNVAVLYIAGHGVVTSQQARWAFLSAAGKYREIYSFGVNVTAVRDRMAFRRARTQIFVWDICALPDDKTPDNPGTTGAMVPRPDRDVEHAGVVDQVTILPRLGTRTWSLNAKRGTILSSVLVGRDADDYRQRLMCRAVSDVGRSTPAVRPDRMKELLPEAVRAAVTSGDPGEAEAVVDARNVRVGLHRPDPMPTFTVTLVRQPIGASETLSITIESEGVVVASLEMAPGTTSLPVDLPAGVYRVSWSTLDDRITQYRLAVTRDEEIDVLEGPDV